VQKKEEDKYQQYKQIGLLTTIPFLLLAGPTVGWLIGSFLDKKFGTEPYLMYLFIILGFIASGKQVYNIIMRASKDNNK